MVVPEEADAVELHDGEVLKLPPTPVMTDGHEQESDPETERVHYASYPGTNRSSVTDLRAPQPRRMMPPPLPPRSAQRPNIARQRSSQSHYSDAEEAPPVPGSSTPHAEVVDVPPAYAEEYAHAASDYPIEKSLPAGAFNDENEPMSEAERREWEQFLTEHQEEERTRAAQPGLHDELARRLEQQQLDEAIERSLR
jgi:signal transduction histidine kinase